MPFIETKTSKTITKEEEKTLVKKLGELVSIFKGKSERWLMLNFVDGERMSFSGRSDIDSAIVSVELFGSASEGEYSSFTEAVTKLISETLSLPKDRIYVKYSEYKTWGYNGENF